MSTENEALDTLRRSTGERCRHYKLSTKATRHWAWAEVAENKALAETGILKDLSILHFRTDDGKPGWVTYGP
jgi:hypothetical protein